MQTAIVANLIAVPAVPLKARAKVLVPLLLPVAASALQALDDLLFCIAKARFALFFIFSGRSGRVFLFGTVHSLYLFKRIKAQIVAAWIRASSTAAEPKSLAKPERG